MISSTCNPAVIAPVTACNQSAGSRSTVASLKAATKLSSKATVQLPVGSRTRVSRRGFSAVRSAYDSNFSAFPTSRPGESDEQTRDRRMNESQAVEDLSINVTTAEQLDAFLLDAGEKLVFVSIESEDECDMGDNPDAWATQSGGNHIADGTHTSMAACAQLKSNLQRVVRDANDVVFLNIRTDPTVPSTQALARDLGVQKYPTFQYYKHNSLVWQHVGAGPEATRSVGEGVLYYGGQGAEGMHSDDFIQDIANKGDLDDFLDQCAAPQTSPMGAVNVACEKQLAILDVSLEKNSAACLHVFPAVLALARNLAGAARWCRLLGDTSQDAKALMDSLNITEVPTFVFFCENKEVGRYVGTDRMKLVDQILELQRAYGVQMPQRAVKKRMSTAEAKAIARAARDAAKNKQWS